MIQSTNFEGKTLEEAKAKALKELNVEEKDVYIKEEFIEGKLFKGSKYVIDVMKKSDIKKYIENFIDEYAKKINLNINYEINQIEDIYNIVLVSDNNSILIGKEGRTLDSFQILLRQAVQRQTNISIKINVDISNYKSNKMKNLEREVRKIAQEVVDTKIEASLDPMNSYERRRIHTLISEYSTSLTTESVGEGRNRHIVIKFKED